MIVPNQTACTSLADSSVPKYSETNSESSGVLPAICAVILASFMLLHWVTAPTQDIFDCYVKNWSSWFLGSKTSWQQFWEIWLVACISHHHPGEFQGVEWVGTLYFNWRKFEAAGTEPFNLCYQYCSHDPKNAPYSRYWCIEQLWQV